MGKAAVHADALRQDRDFDGGYADHGSQHLDFDYHYHVGHVHTDHVYGSVNHDDADDVDLSDDHNVADDVDKHIADQLHVGFDYTEHHDQPDHDVADYYYVPDYDDLR